jgi:insulysin
MATHLKVVPVREMRRLSLAWPLPYNWEKQHAIRASKPSRYLSHVLGHVGPGSLHSYLNSQGTWVGGWVRGGVDLDRLT